MNTPSNFFIAGNKNLPFGGKQILFVGDIFQLPPVVDNSGMVENMVFKEVYKSEYFFDSPCYKLSNPYYLEFKISHRQKDDLPFVQLLDKIRICQADDDTLNKINERVNASYIPRREDFVITLTSTNIIASDENANKLRALTYSSFFFEAQITGEFPEEKFQTSKVLELKRNAQVILIKNDSSRRWVNGTIAKIDFISQDLIQIKLSDGTTHSLEKVTWENRRYKYDKSKNKIVSEILGTFTQYPLKLARAITIHKSHGLTFDNVIIDLGNRAFVNGQVYTALSRCRKLDGIILKRSLRHEDIISDRRVINFHQTEQFIASLSEEADEI